MNQLGKSGKNTAITYVSTPSIASRRIFVRMTSSISRGALERRGSPYLTDADNSEGLRRAAEWLKTASPRTTVAPTSATLVPASFLVGDTTAGKGKCVGKPPAG